MSFFSADHDDTIKFGQTRLLKTSALSHSDFVFPSTAVASKRFVKYSKFSICSCKLPSTLDKALFFPFKSPHCCPFMQPDLFSPLKADMPKQIRLKFGMQKAVLKTRQTAGFTCGKALKWLALLISSQIMNRM